MGSQEPICTEFVRSKTIPPFYVSTGQIFFAQKKFRSCRPIHKHLRCLCLRLYTSMKLPVHLVTSLVNSACVTILTSLAMTSINSTLTVQHWLPNWLVSWFIVFNFVYWLAPLIAQRIQNHYE